MAPANANVKLAPIFQPRKNQNVDTAPTNLNSMENLRQENDALRKENESLKKQVENLQQQVSELKKRKASSTLDESTAVSKRAKTPAQRRKLFEKWAKAAARVSAKHKLNNPVSFMPETYSAEVKETTPWTKADFEAVFMGSSGGVKIQPTPGNKPTSQITIVRWNSHEKIQALFGSDVTVPKDGYTCQTWRQRNFCKSYRTDDANSSLASLSVEYNKSKQTLKLQFGFEVQVEDY